MRAEYERANDKGNFKFSRLLKAGSEANAEENRATEKFLDNVESIMRCFNNELDCIERNKLLKIIQVVKNKRE